MKQKKKTQQDQCLAAKVTETATGNPEETIMAEFDRTLEAKGLSDAYFDQLERKIKEHEFMQEERERYIDKILYEE